MQDKWPSPCQGGSSNELDLPKLQSQRYHHVTGNSPEDAPDMDAQTRVARHTPSLQNVEGVGKCVIVAYLQLEA